MNRDELEGKAEQVKGKVKQGVGDLTDNERLHDEGVADEAGGAGTTKVRKYESLWFYWLMRFL